MRNKHPEPKEEYQSLDLTAGYKRYYYAFELLPEKNIKGWIVPRLDRHLFARFKAQYDRDDWVRDKADFRKAIYSSYPPLKNLNSRQRKYTNARTKRAWRINEEGVEVC